MSIKLDGLSAKELEALITQANQRRKLLAKRKPVAVVRQKLAALARAEGYTLSELFPTTTTGPTPKAKPRSAAPASRGARPSGNKGVKVAPKFRNPADASQTWAGRGQQPKWLAGQIAQGKRLEDFAITR